MCALLLAEVSICASFSRRAPAQGDAAAGSSFLPASACDAAGYLRALRPERALFRTPLDVATTWMY